MIGNEKLNKIALAGVILFLYLTFIFGRSFIGLYVFGFRLGELIIGFLLIFTLITFFIDTSFFGDDYQIIKIKKVLNVLLFLFLLTSILTNSNLFNLYTYKVSSYVWVIPCIYIGYYFSESFLENKIIAIIFSTSLPIVYILSTVKFPDLLITFFEQNSDKFDFVKASDLLMVYVFVNMLLRLCFSNKLISFGYLIISSAVMFPMFLFKSKGSFVGFTVFLIFEIFHYKDLIKKNILKTFLLLLTTPLFFIVSSFEISGDSLLNGLFVEQPTLENVEKQIEPEIINSPSEPSLENSNTIEAEVISETLLDNFDNKIAGNGLEDNKKLVEIVDGRIYTSDNTLNWRLQIWQDVVYDLIDKGQIIYGYGYTEIIPAMDTIARSGVDNKNENVHNFLINIIARGGLLHFLVISSLFILFYLSSNKKNILLFTIPLLIVSFFDSSMESVRFPTIFYFVVGSFLNHNNSRKSDIIE